MDWESDIINDEKENLAVSVRFSVYSNLLDIIKNLEGSKMLNY